MRLERRKIFCGSEARMRLGDRGIALRRAYDGDVGPSGDFGLGLLVYLTPKMFARIDAAVVYEREDRSGQSVAVWGTLPAIGVGGTL